MTTTQSDTIDWDVGVRSGWLVRLTGRRSEQGRSHVDHHVGRDRVARQRHGARSNPVGDVADLAECDAALVAVTLDFGQPAAELGMGEIELVPIDRDAVGLFRVRLRASESVDRGPVREVVRVALAWALPRRMRDEAKP